MSFDKTKAKGKTIANKCTIRLDTSPNKLTTHTQLTKLTEIKTENILIKMLFWAIDKNPTVTEL